MKKNQISFMTILAIVGAYAAYGIGSGFATGQEVLQYFASWGVGGCIIAILCSAILLSYTFSSVVRVGETNADIFKKSSDGYTYYGGKILGKIIDIFSWVVIFFVLIAMFAGCGATIKQYWGMPVYIGTIIMCVASTIVVMLGLHRIQQALGFLGVVFIVYIIAFGLFCLFSSDVTLSESTRNLSTYIEEGKVLQAGIFGIYNPVWAGLNYGGCCLVSAFPFVIALGRRTKNPLEARIAGFNAGLWFHIPAFFAAFAILLNLDYIASDGQQVPLLAAITNSLPSMSWTFAIILILGIFTTITGYMWFLVDRLADEKTAKYKITTLIVAIIGTIGGSIIPFNVILNIVFPVTGIVGMALAVLIVIKNIRNRLEKNTQKLEIDKP